MVIAYHFKHLFCDEIISNLSSSYFDLHNLILLTVPTLLYDRAPARNSIWLQSNHYRK